MTEMPAILRIPPIRSGVLMLAVGLLGACAGSERIDTTYYDRSAVPAPYGRVLVIGVAATARARDLFETSLVSAIRNGETQALSSIRIMGTTGEIDRETIVATVRESGADAVIVTRLVSQDTAAKLKISRTESKVVRKDDRAVDFFRYDYLEFKEPPDVSMLAQTVLSTDVYAAASRELVWSSQSSSFDKGSLREIVSAQGSIIAARLKRDGLIH